MMFHFRYDENTVDPWLSRLVRGTENSSLNNFISIFDQKPDRLKIRSSRYSIISKLENFTIIKSAKLIFITWNLASIYKIYVTTYLITGFGRYCRFKFWRLKVTWRSFQGQPNTQNENLTKFLESRDENVYAG